MTGLIIITYRTTVYVIYCSQSQIHIFGNCWSDISMHEPALYSSFSEIFHTDFTKFNCFLKWDNFVVAVFVSSATLFSVGNDVIVCKVGGVETCLWRSNLSYLHVHNITVTWGHTSAVLLTDPLHLSVVNVVDGNPHGQIYSFIHFS